MTTPPPPRWAVAVPRFAAPLVLVMGLGYLALGSVRDIGLLQFVGAALTVLSLVIGFVAVMTWRRERQGR